MHTNNWHLFHSRLSFALNIKLVSPLSVIKQVENTFLTGKTKADIAQVEGFIRQILGWREYMRGIYWAQMPGYSNLNYFGHQNKLPDWYWTGDTKLNCLKHAIKQSLEHAYAHHIQRLMITGNFALLAQVHPNEVDAWYLGIYIDAFEWVEITNTRGMSQFADGGMVGTKPYVSSSAYIDKMSNYCKTCYYDKTKKLGDRACPFNSLYWNFYETHNQLLNKNPRVGMMLNVLHKMEKQTRQALLRQAELYLANINDL
jgi:deoxyribodipyrimidine photolyase-related protein